MLGSLLALGLLLGLRHALEADHVSTVATLARGSRSTRETVGVAAAWGLGHALALGIAGVVLVALGMALPERLSRLLEGAVAAILIALGVGVLRRLRARRIHLHLHEHDGSRHLHFHSHQSGASHHHLHAPLRFGRSFAIGSVHGLAGTAALGLLALPATHSPAQAVLSLAVFGLGSILGMVALSLVVSLPLRLTAGRLGHASPWFEGLLGAFDVGLGAFLLFGLWRG